MFLHCRLCAFLFRILTLVLYALLITNRKNPHLFTFQCTSILFSPSSNKHPHLPVITVASPVLPHPFLCLSSALAISSNLTGRCSSSGSTDTVLSLPETQGFAALRVSPTDSCGIFFISIIKLADVG